MACLKNESKCISGQIKCAPCAQRKIHTHLNKWREQIGTTKNEEDIALNLCSDFFEDGFLSAGSIKKPFEHKKHSKG